MMTSTYPTAAFQAGAPSASYQQPNAAEYGYGTGNTYNNYSLPTSATDTANTAAAAYGGPAQNMYKSNRPYQQQQQQQQTAQQLYAYPETTPPDAYGSTTNEGKAGDGEKTKRRWSLNFRSKTEVNDGAAENPSNATSNNKNSNNNNSSSSNPKRERRWSLNFRSRNDSRDESSSEKSSSHNKDTAASAAANQQQQLVVYSVPPSETASQQQRQTDPNFRPDEVHPEKQAMKNDRKAKMAGAATTGAIIGGVLTGPAWPVGAMAGAAIATYAGKVTARAGERRQQRKWEQRNFNDYLAKGKAGVQSESVAFA